MSQRIMVVDYTAKGDSFAPGKPRAWSEKRILLIEGGGPFPPYDLAPEEIARASDELERNGKAIALRGKDGDRSVLRRPR